MAHATAFFASFFYVALKAFQQLNVVHDEFKWVMPVSLGMAACEVTVVTSIVRTADVWLVLCIGVGAGFGAMISMLLHRRMRNAKRA